MSRKRYIEVSCDECSAVIDYFGGFLKRDSINEIMRGIGAVVDGRKDFCSEECRDNYVKRVGSGCSGEKKGG